MIDYYLKYQILIKIKYTLFLISIIYLFLENMINLKFVLFFKKININNYNKIDNKIRLAIYTHSLNNGGVERNTAILINYIVKIKIFEIYLFTDIITNKDYKIDSKIKRIIILSNLNTLKRKVLKNKINIFIYQSYDFRLIHYLKTIKKLKIILYNHSCFLFWIYSNEKLKFKSIYNEYKNSNYVISIIPFENEFIFKKWGINSIYIDNFLTYDYNKVIQSNLLSKNILMIGRGSDENKRFDLGIISMKFILNQIPEAQMIVISDNKELKYIKQLVKSLFLEDNINFVGYISGPDIYFKNASLHIFPSISEAFPMALSETKIYGIPNILVGIDYVSNSKGGVVIIYDDNPETIAKYAIKILNNEEYKKKLSKEARKSMKKYNNNILIKKWAKLLMNIYNNDSYNKSLYKYGKLLHENETLYILENQIKLLRKRIPRLNNININDILNFTFMENINYI